MEELKNGKLFSLFPTPVYRPNKQYLLNKEEIDFVTNQKTYKNVAHNSTSYNTRVLDDVVFSSLKNHIQTSIDDYSKDVLKIDYSKVQVYITQSWINYNNKNTAHHHHSHPNSIVSGVFFIVGDECPIAFDRDTKLFQNLKIPQTSYESYITSERYRFSNEQGYMYLFPSTLKHSVQMNKSDKTRISLSFNTFLKGKLGNESTLDALEIK